MIVVIRTSHRSGRADWQQALNTLPPGQCKDVRFTATDVVTEWLKKHGK
ncbi:MAG: hypothetical protein ICV83_02510 [Cytophagales bacterium]|nr:hypothetical protein [Cytophagales bacterium]